MMMIISIMMLLLLLIMTMSMPSISMIPCHISYKTAYTKGSMLKVNCCHC